MNLVDQSIDPHTQKRLEDKRLPANERDTLLTQHEKIISRFKYDILTIDISTTELTIRTCNNIIAIEKKKLTDTAHGQVPLPKFLIDILSAIGARQSNISKRAQVVTQHKLSFFDDAPTVIEQQQQMTGNETVGAIV